MPNAAAKATFFKAEAKTEAKADLTADFKAEAKSRICIPGTGGTS
jgi:hypothetical protein